MSACILQNNNCNIMRKVILVLLGLLPIFSFAGVIMTTNGERIEDVTIQSETSESIVYVENGVEKTISIEQVQAVLFDNGNFKEYPKYTSPVVVNDPAVTANENVMYATQKPQRQVQPRQPRQPMDWNAFDPDGKKLWLSGLITGGSGLGLILVGSICMGVGGNMHSSGDYYGGGTTQSAGASLLSLGCGATAASIPLLTIGGMRKFKKEDKTAEVAQSYILELQAQKNLIGLALKF